MIHKTKSNFIASLFPPKAVSEPDPATGLYNPFPNYPFTGSLRPVYPLSPRRDVPASIPRPDYVEDGIPRSERRFRLKRTIAILNQEEQEAMRKVCRLTREVLDIAAREIRPGVTTDYIDEVVHKACIERNVSISHMLSKFSTDRGFTSKGISVASKLHALSEIGLYLYQ